MMKFILPCILFFVACASGEAPKDVIAMKPMQKIIWDMLLADELAMQNKLSDTTLDLKPASFRLYDQVFAIHKVSRERFFKSYEYYQRRPELFRTLITGVKKISEKERRSLSAPSLQR